MEVIVNIWCIILSKIVGMFPIPQDSPCIGFQDLQQCANWYNTDPEFLEKQYMEARKQTNTLIDQERAKLHALGTFGDIYSPDGEFGLAALEAPVINPTIRVGTHRILGSFVPLADLYGIENTAAGDLMTYSDLKRITALRKETSTSLNTLEIDANVSSPSIAPLNTTILDTKNMGASADAMSLGALPHDHVSTNVTKLEHVITPLEAVSYVTLQEQTTLPVILSDNIADLTVPSQVTDGTILANLECSTPTPENISHLPNPLSTLPTVMDSAQIDEFVEVCKGGVKKK